MEIDPWLYMRRRGKPHLQAMFRRYCETVGELTETTVLHGLKTEKYLMPNGENYWIVSLATASDRTGQK